MSPLYLCCVLCERRTADGLLSRNAWKVLEVPVGVDEMHPALQGATHRVCPNCVQVRPDWQERMLVVLGVTTTPSDLQAAQ
jgi:hypothetical protein